MFTKLLFFKFYEREGENLFQPIARSIRTVSEREREKYPRSPREMMEFRVSASVGHTELVAPVVG